MQQHIHKIRVRYGETDKMGYVYYGNYPLYLEEARTELIRSLGFTYQRLEGQGVGMPVVNLNITYKRPSFYDDVITLKTHIKGIPSRKICFYTEMYNANNKLLITAMVTLVFMDMKTNKAISIPQNLATLLKPFVEE